MPKVGSRDKERSRAGKRPGAPRRYDVDPIAAALRQLYARIAAEPLPRRLVTLLNRLKVRH
ncbi:MAG TPA: NepR family anti-sigma factor [Stellaceae bacterium]|nr:NepR family anti-sigma factor [Stellaceae bacterium]